MSGFTISASEYQAMIARRDIRIAELTARLAKYESPDHLPQDDRIVGWMVYCPPGHEYDYMVFADEQSADSQAVDWESDVPHGSPIERYPLIPLVRLYDVAKHERPDDAEPVTGDWLRSVGFRRTGILPNGNTFAVDELGGDAWVSVSIETGASSMDIGSVYGGSTFILPNPTRGQLRRLIAALKGEP